MQHYMKQGAVWVRRLTGLLMFSLVFALQISLAWGQDINKPADQAPPIAATPSDTQPSSIPGDSTDGALPPLPPEVTGIPLFKFWLWGATLLAGIAAQYAFRRFHAARRPRDWQLAALVAPFVALAVAYVPMTVSKDIFDGFSRDCLSRQVVDVAGNPLDGMQVCADARENIGSLGIKTGINWYKGSKSDIDVRLTEREVFGIYSVFIILWSFIFYGLIHVLDRSFVMNKRRR